jgi:hypothetical protein
MVRLVRLDPTEVTGWAPFPDLQPARPGDPA